MMTSLIFISVEHAVVIVFKKKAFENLCRKCINWL